MAREVVIVVRTETGYHHNLRRPAGHIEEPVDVRIIAHQLAVCAPDDGVDAADGLRRRVDLIAQGHHVPLVGDGDVQAADVLPVKKGSQSIRLQLEKAVGAVAQGGMDGDGPAVAQLPAQQAVNPLIHGSDFRVVAQELELGTAALHLLQHGQDAGILDGGVQLQEENKLKVTSRHGAGL